jgi:hypothetical protein
VAGEGVAEALAHQGPAAPEAEVVEAMACQEAGAAAVRGLLRGEAEQEAQAHQAPAAAESQEHPEAKAGPARAEEERLESA